MKERLTEHAESFDGVNFYYARSRCFKTSGQSKIDRGRKRGRGGGGRECQREREKEKERGRQTDR